MRQIWLAMLTVALAVPAWAEEPFSARLNLAEAYRLARAHDARLAAHPFFIAVTGMVVADRNHIRTRARQIQSDGLIVRIGHDAGLARPQSKTGMSEPIYFHRVRSNHLWKNPTRAYQQVPGVSGAPPVILTWAIGEIWAPLVLTSAT